LPMIVDASALAWLPPGPTPQTALRVITPHPGEAARLLQSQNAHDSSGSHSPASPSSKEVQANRISSLRQLSQRFGNCWVVLKGHQTIIGRNTGEVFVNCSGNPNLAQGGSGDVLAGYLAGLLAQPELQRNPLHAIRFAVW